MRFLHATLAFASLFPALPGCAARYRTEVVGTGNALVTPRGAPSDVHSDVVAAPGAGGITLPRGSYDVALRFDIPRAQRIDWHVRCPGAALEGAIGEPFDVYRERRLDELRAQRERDRQRMAAATNLLVGAVTPRVSSRARVVTPAGEVIVESDARVSGTGEAVAQALPTEEVVELPYGDTGRGRLGANVRIHTAAPGVCTITAATDDPTVLASFQVTRIHDLQAEAYERRAAQTSGAIALRTRIRTQLVTFGADETARQRKLEAEARARAAAEVQADLEARARAQVQLQVSVEANARAEAEAHVHAEAEARAEADARARLEVEARLRWEAEAPARAHAELVARWRTEAYTTRELVIAWLVGECHADPDRRARLEAQAYAERAHRQAERDRLRAERELQIRLRLQARDELRARLRAERDARLAREAAIVAELEQRRIEGALRIRGRIAQTLVAMGAVLRPPRPEPQLENPGATPFDGARWTAGLWSWTGRQWQWHAGGWTDPESFGATGGEVVVRGTAPVIYDAGVIPDRATITIVQPNYPPPVDQPWHPPVSSPIHIRDHRNPAPPSPTVRDHRTAPVVRDHRPAKPAEDKPKVRDHRH